MNNSDLISRSAAIEIIRSMTINLGGKDIFTPEAKKSVIGVLDEIDAVDAEPVRHARWEDTPIGTIKCTLCGCCYNMYKGFAKYCPNCGAKMDGDENAADR